MKVLDLIKNTRNGIAILIDPDKFKSVAINIKTYHLLEELSQRKFELPISMSKTVEFYIQKAHEDYKGSNGKKSKQ